MRNIELLQKLYDKVQVLEDYSGKLTLPNTSSYFDYNDIHHCFIGHIAELLDISTALSDDKIACQQLGLTRDEYDFLCYRNFERSNKEDGLNRLQFLIDGGDIKDYEDD